ncbi:hypothetical protein ACQCSU_14910 [Pseudarthrobacter sp. O4]|uniref:hypothetical protein n=1 Tax=Pseudarthrobacter sp. O4 TaxID=3418417 RepID=UPI003CF1557A
MGELELAGIAARLYALPFDDFVAARTAAAKEVAAASGKGITATDQRSLAADVRSLPKPSVAAWTVNMLAARQPETLRELAALGQSMRAAQSALDAAELRKLAQHRRQLLAAAVRDAQAVAAQQGRKISGAIATEVEETLRAATADEGAAEAVRSGRLLRGLSADGVDVVDLAGAVALPSLAIPAASVAVPSKVPSSSSAPAGARATKHAAPKHAVPKQAAQPRLRAVREESRAPAPSALERAREALDQAEQSAREATEEALRYGQELDEARALAAGLAEAALTLRKQLEQTELDLKSARKQHELVAAQAQRAVRASDRARRKEDLARERVLRLGNTPG